MLSVTGGAVRRWVDLPIVDKLFSDFTLSGFLGLHLAVWIAEELEFALLVFRLPLEVEDFIERTDVLGRIPVAVKTPGHAHWFSVLHDAHLTDIAVATLTADTAVDVHRVIEVNVVRRLVNPLPFYWLAIEELVVRIRRLANRLQQLTAQLHRLVAVPTNLRRWHVRVTGILHHRVAITTIHTELPNVQFVIVRNRLIRLVSDARIFGREVVGHRHGNETAEDGDAGDDLEQDRITPTRKEIGHFRCDIYGLVKNFTSQKPAKMRLFSHRAPFEAFCNP